MFYTKKTIDEKLQTLNDLCSDAGQRLVAQLNTLEDSISDRIADAITQHELRKEVLAQKTADERQNSEIPFVEVISSGYDPELGVQMQLDWNAAFIKELKAKGYRGRSERDLVNKWLVATHKQLAEQFEQSDKV
jgi:hypothetical protein